MKLTLNNSVYVILALIVTPLLSLVPNHVVSHPLVALAFWGGLMCTLSLSARMFFILIGYLLTVVTLHVTQGYALYGDWLLFTLTGYIMVVVVGRFSLGIVQPRSMVSALLLFILTCVALQFWTNLGAWWFSAMYTHSIQGFLASNVAVLPFLERFILSNCLWAFLIMIYAQYRMPKHRYAL